MRIVNMTVDLQLARQLVDADAAEVPCSATIERWVTETFLAINRVPINVTVRVVGEEEMIELNHRYRGKDSPTNVLAFPFEPVAEVDCHYLGDIVICFAVVKEESNQQGKPVQSHFSHMVIHGMLHLCGFDHQTDDQAITMEGVEKDILAKIRIRPPRMVEVQITQEQVFADYTDGGSANNAGAGIG